MKYIQIFFMILYVLATSFACQSLLEQDIEGDKVYLRSPYDGLVTDDYNQTFWWDKVQGASKYNIQIVSPSFTMIRKLVLDSNLTSNQFTMTLYPDSFEWRVKGINDAYETEYAYFKFKIDSTAKPQVPIGLKPEDPHITNDEIITFSWNEAPNAESYGILIVKKEYGQIISKEQTENTQITYPDELIGTEKLTEAEYLWSVISYNEKNESSDYSTEQNLWIDRTAPDKPIINIPTPQDTVSNFYLAWTRPNNDGSPIMDSIIMYKDSTGNEIHLSTKTDSTIYNYTGTTDTWYRYKVKSVDAAENEGEWSDIRYFFYKEGTDE